jgi:fructokinase
VGIGELLWDVFPDESLPGGAPANFAFHAGQLGHRALVVSRVGDDLPGRDLLDVLRGNCLSTEHVQVDPRKPTGHVPVEVSPDGTPTFTVVEDVAWDYIAEDPALAGVVASADLVCFGTLAQRSEISRRTIHALVRSCRRQVLFDVNLRHDFWSPGLISDCLAMSTIAKLNLEETGILQDVFPGQAGQVDWCRALIERFGLGLVCITRGKDGCLLVGRDGSADHPGVPVEVVDTVGCGDAFSAAIAHGVLTGMGLGPTAELACQVGAFVASRPGATPPLPARIIQAAGNQAEQS